MIVCPDLHSTRGTHSALFPLHTEPGGHGAPSTGSPTTKEHTPRVGPTHVSHEPAQARSQQTSPTQKPLAHSSSVPHATPSTPAQTPPGPQVSSPAQVSGSGPSATSPQPPSSPQTRQGSSHA